MYNILAKEKKLTYTFVKTISTKLEECQDMWFKVWNMMKYFNILLII